MPLILAIETSSRVGSVAIALGEKMLAETIFSGPMRHSAEIFPAIQELLNRYNKKSREIEHVYISIGPGSFTGLRIATTIAKSMYLASAVKIVAVDTLDVIAANVIDLTGKRGTKDRAATVRERSVGPAEDRRATSYDKIATLLDAKRNQFFIAVYERTNNRQEAKGNRMWKKILPDSLMTASQFIEKFAQNDKPIWLLGDGLLYHKDKFKTKNIRFFDHKYWSPKAGKVHLLGWHKFLAGQFADPVTLTPNYLRRSEAEEKWQPPKNI